MSGDEYAVTMRTRSFGWISESRAQVRAATDGALPVDGDHDGARCSAVALRRFVESGWPA